MTALITTIVVSYIIGSIPTSIIVARLLRGIDIREYGSGNAGGTNTVRVLGWKPGLFVSAIDVLKGIVPVLWIAPLVPETLSLDPRTIALMAGCAAIAGHIWTVFAGFRGGKGVATGAGVLLILYPHTFFICLIVFVAVLLVSRVVAVASISAALAFPAALTVFRFVLDRPVPDPLYYFGFAVAVLIVFTHRSNIRRLLTK